MTEEENLKIRKEALDLVDGFLRALASFISKPDTPEPPERVWDCLFSALGDFRDCGRWRTKNRYRGKPVGWHQECWDAYQIKTLRGMVGKLMGVLSRADKFRPELSHAAHEEWAEVVNQLGELYPGRKDDSSSLNTAPQACTKDTP